MICMENTWHASLLYVFNASWWFLQFYNLASVTSQDWILFVQFYNLASVTETESKDAESFKTTKIKKKKMAVVELPNITLSNFLRMSKEGVW
jgi:hypothetical protein